MMAVAFEHITDFAQDQESAGQLSNLAGTS
jgi:hypothetical protein